MIFLLTPGKETINEYLLIIVKNIIKGKPAKRRGGVKGVKVHSGFVRFGNRTDKLFREDIPLMKCHQRASDDRKKG